MSQETPRKEYYYGVCGSEQSITGRRGKLDLLATVLGTMEIKRLSAVSTANRSPKCHRRCNNPQIAR